MGEKNEKHICFSFRQIVPLVCHGHWIFQAKRLRLYASISFFRPTAHVVYCFTFRTSQRSSLDGRPSNVLGQMCADPALPTASDTWSGTRKSFNAWFSERKRQVGRRDSVKPNPSALHPKLETLCQLS